MSRSSPQPLEVLIAGGGVAGLEAALALRSLAGDRVNLTLMAPEPEFVYRPMAVREPFGSARAGRMSLCDIAAELDADLVPDGLRWLEPEARIVHTAGGASLPYGALVLALGARLRQRFHHALTLDDRELDAQLHGLLQDVEEGYVASLAFLVPDAMPWPLPVYELALMTAGRAYEMNIGLSVTVVTPEDAPLALFGAAASHAVQDLLQSRGIAVVTSAHGAAHRPGQVTIHPGPRRLIAQRIVALPELVGPAVAGVPRNAAGGFIPTDLHGRVRGLERVWAAGDATAFPVKHGGIAAQQADAVAQSIAALAGVELAPQPFHPIISGILLGGPEPLYLRAHVTGGHGAGSWASNTPPDDAAKIEARYLGPFLRKHGFLAGSLS